MNTNNIIVAVVLGFVLILFNTIFLAIIFFTRRRMNIVSKWPSVTGTVLTSMLEVRNSEDGTVNYPLVQYGYQVGGQTFQGSRIAPGMEVGGSGAGKVIARYPVGTQVPVFYNPQNPSDAVLEHKAPAQFWIWFILILFDVILCCVTPTMYWVLSK